MSARTAALLKIAPPYDEGLIRSLEQGFSRKLGEPVQFTVAEDSALLCGFIAYVRGIVYDMSGKTQLDGLREHLLDSILAPPAPAEEGGAEE